MVLHGHTSAQRKRLRETRGRLKSKRLDRVTGRARAASVNKGQQGLLKRSVDRTLQLRTGRGEPASLKAALTRGKTRPTAASSISRRPAKGTVDRTLELRRAKTRRLRQIGVTRNR